MQKIEAVPHTKIEKIRRFVSEWLVNGDVEASETMGKIAAVLIEPDPIVPNDQVIAEMLERIRMTEQSERSADQQVERLQAELQNLRSQRCGQAEAWVAVFNTLCSCVPSWLNGADGVSTIEVACSTIRQLAADLERWKRSERAQVETIMMMQAEAQGLREQIERLQVVTDASQATAAARDVLVECRRQVVAEGWTPKHDDDHNSGDLAKAAAAYAMAAVSQTQGYTVNRPPLLWPWDKAWWKPCDARRSLVKAGALILAEVERLDRADAQADARMEIVARNGNTGEHYAELAIQQGGKPVDELPEGLTWAQAPEWAHSLGETIKSKQKVWFDDERYQYVVRDEARGPWKFGDVDNFARDRNDVALIATRPAPAERRDATRD